MSRPDLGRFEKASTIAISVLDGIRSPRRMSVSEAATKYAHNQNGPWSAELTPYTVKPMDCTTSRKYTGVILVGSARSGKTQSIFEGKISHSVQCDPGDIGAYFPTEDNARDFSYRRIDRMHQYSPEMLAMLSTRGSDNNIMRKRYRNGMLLDFLYPASSQVAQREFRTVLLSDYDAMPVDVSGEGGMFALAGKRTQTFLSSGVTVAESSPRFQVIKRGWVGKTPHEAPPVAAGILPLYNMGDRHRWYWRCMECSTPFEAPPLPDFDYIDATPLATVAATAYVKCPSCGHRHIPTDKRALNLQSDVIGDQWVADGQTMQRDGTITGQRENTPIASFWFMGCAAAFQPWESLVLGELQGLAEVASKGSEETLRSKRNIDQGIPYVPVAIAASRTPEALQQAAEDMQRSIVPDGALIVTAAVDVQGSKFVVQVQAWGIGFETWVIDRFDIALSDRTVDGRPQSVAPGVYAEDWELIIADTITSKKYCTRDGVIFPVAMTGNDTGGVKGVAHRAYAFFRTLRNNGLARRFRLLKGDGKSLEAPELKEFSPNSTKKTGGKNTASVGDVPVMFLNSKKLKDAVDQYLNRKDHGPGYVHLPRWADMSFFEEMCAEGKDDVGRWVKLNSGDNNETWDLLYYNLAMVKILGADNWGEQWERCPTFDVIYDVPEPVALAHIQPPPRRQQQQGFGSNDWEF